MAGAVWQMQIAPRDIVRTVFSVAIKEVMASLAKNMMIVDPTCTVVGIFIARGRQGMGMVVHGVINVRVIAVVVNGFHGDVAE